MKTILLRMTLKTYKRLRRNFKAKRKESAASYFERLSKMLDNLVGSTIRDTITFQEGDDVINGQTPSRIKIDKLAGSELTNVKGGDEDDRSNR